MFDKDIFIQALAERIAQALRVRAVEFKKHRLGAVAMYVAPWHNCIWLNVMIETDKLRKWYMGDWEHNVFAELSDLPGLEEAWEVLHDPKGGKSSYAPLFSTCAKAR